jgi:hypothetical protein
MQDLFEVYSGSTTDASFIKNYLEGRGVKTTIKNSAEESLLAGWEESNGIIGTQIFVAADDYERAEKLVREYMESREE